MHGQSDQLRLLRPAEQRAALDRFAGPEHEKLLDAFRETYTRWRAVDDDLADRRRNARERHQEADLLRLGLDEITRVDPQPGEDEELRAEAQRLEHAEGLRVAPRRSRTRRSPAAARPTEETPDAASLLGTARRTLEAQAGGRPGARRAGRRGWRRRPRWSPTSPRSCPRYLAALDADPARLQADLRAAGRAARPDPQVRRRRRRRDRLGRPGPDPAGRAGHLRRAARRAGPGAAAAGRARSAELAGRLSAARREAAARFADAGHRRAGRAGHAARAGRGGGAARVRPAGTSRRSRSTASRSGSGRTAPTRSSCGCWPTRARRRCRCRRAPPAASCPG